jgi:glycosyltransferase involved in cell wall biosynthesis
MSDRKSVMVVSFSDIKRDPRVFRQVKSLSSKYEVTTVALGDSGLADVKHVSVVEIGKSKTSKVRRAIELKTGDYRTYYESTFNAKALRDTLDKASYDLILANDSDSLPLVFSWDHEIPVIHDAHEFAPRQIEDRWRWRFLMQGYMEWICETYLRRCAAITTVSNGIAQAYSSSYGVKPEVITNAPDFVELEPSPVDGDHIHLVHTGNANPSRRIEKYLELMGLLDERFYLDLYLMPRDPGYLERIKTKAKRYPRTKVMPPVPMQDLVRVCNGYDVGVFFQEPLNFNLEHSLPNKFFEFVQARLAIAITPLPEMSAYVRRYDLGIVGTDFHMGSLAGQLKGLDQARIEHYKRQASMAARPLSSEANMNLLDRLVSNVMAETIA